MTAAIEDLFDNNRLSTGWLLLPVLIYLPFGLLLALLRFFVGVHTFLIACLLPKTVAMRRLFLRIMCFFLGIVINEEETKYKASKAKVIVTNNITILDHLIVNMVLPCTVPNVYDLPNVLTWCLGYKDFGIKQGREVFVYNVQKHCRESDMPIMTQPEETTTNGRVGLLKFSVWPFSIEEPVMPIVTEVRRFYLLNVALSVIGSRWWADLFWFLFSPCTIFTIRYLPVMRRAEGTSEEEFAEDVRKAMVSALRLKATNFTAADKMEYFKRSLIQTPPPHSSYSATSNTTLNVMANQVKEVLPYVPIDVIKRDLVRTNSVSLTISNILEGTVNYVSEQEVDINVLGSTSSTSTSSSSSQLDEKIIPSTTSLVGDETIEKNQSSTNLRMAANSFGKTANERMMSYNERKRRLIEISRQKYLEKHE